MERMSLLSDRYSVEIEVRADLTVRVDCFQFIAELQRKERPEGVQIPRDEFIGMVRSAIGADAAPLTENEAYSVGRRVMVYLETLGKD